MVERHELPQVIHGNGKEEASKVLEYILGAGYGDIHYVVKDHRVTIIEWTERIVGWPTERIKPSTRTAE